MVQRKLPTKLTLQSDHAKAQSFLHHHDVKSPRGADLKAKKMKKSGSIKRPKHPPPPSTSTSTPPLCKSKTTPNYMKSTTSSDARKEQLRKSGVSSSLGKGKGKRNIVDFYEQDSDGSDMEWEIGYGSPMQFDYDYGSSDEKHVADAVNFKEFCVDDVLMDEEEASQESMDEEGFTSDAFSSSDDGDSTCLYDDMQNIKTSSPLNVSIEEEEEEEEDDEEKNILFEYKSPRTDSPIINQEYKEASSFDDPNLPSNGAVAEKEDTALLRYAGSSKRPVKDEDDELGAFNPRGPNFLPLEADPQAEKVDLRHQDLDERKNLEEWMVDYALRQVLGPARKRKVAMLVEAFEKVTPRTKFSHAFSI